MSNEENLAVANVEEPHKRNVRIGVYWKRPPTVTYASNFGFGVNAYQPMIDYLDAKDTGATYDKKDIYLPFLVDRCMNKYSCDKPFRKYTNVDINNYIDKGDNIIRQIRQNDAIGLGGSSLTRTHTNWSMSKKWVQLVKKSNVIDYRKLREARLAEEQRDAPISRRANNSRGRSRQTRSRTPSFSRRGLRSTSRGSETPVRSLSSSVSGRQRLGRKMADTYDEALGSLAHSNLDHQMLMASRRDRLEELDMQFEDVIENLAHSLAKLNKRTKNVENAVSENMLTRDEVLEADDDRVLENKLRRRRELSRISDSVDELTRPDRTRHVSRDLNNELDDMNERLSTISLRQHDERLADLDALTALTQAAAAYAARKRISRAMDFEDFGDEDVEYLRKRNNGVKQQITVEKPRPKRNLVNASKLSDVHARVINKASELSSTSSAARRINHRARYVNLYTPKPETGDPDLIVKPSKTEINIDNMAKSFVERGKMSRRYAIDDEVDPPVSNLNTNAYNHYRNREVQRTIADVPSNSSRVRYAVIRARARNTLLGH